jgi:4-amino-4-deoxy-L-arabinose transferase-like glycosyltransferase
MNLRLLSAVYVALLLAVCGVFFPDGAVAMIVATAFAGGIALILASSDRYSKELLNIFLLALILRIAASATIHFFKIEDFFAGDWHAYDSIGEQLANYWTGVGPYTDLLNWRVYSFRGTMWGICIFVGSIYTAFGKNVLAVQFLIAVIGAATAPVTYLCTYQIFNNRRVATIAGYVVAMMPSLILWSSLMLKDGIMVFLLVLAIYCSIKLQTKFDLKHVLILMLALMGILSLRFYIFYVVGVAIVGGFVAGQKNTMRSIVTRSLAVIIIGTGLGYFGFLDNASREIEAMTSLEAIQNSRLDLATSARSGFGENIDVSTTSGALTALPIGFTYLLLAPFPWQITSTLAALTLPEMLVWWVMIPFMVAGLIYSVRKRLREALSMLIFTVMLTLGYSILQGNVGTAYRQRAQIQVFLFMFVAVGIALYLERRENHRLLTAARNRQFAGRVGVPVQ